MKIPVSEHQIYLDAFMKTAQYLASLTTHEDVWLHIREVMVNFYGASVSGFATRGSDGRPEYHHITLPAEISRDHIETKDFQETVIEVLETGFLAQRVIPAQLPHTIVFLPINIANETTAVLLVGHATAIPISPELLNVYLAVSGLAGTTITRLNSEIELKRHRNRLEELVAERTIKLTQAMERLEVEISVRKQAEDALRLARDELEIRVHERTGELTRANQELKEKTQIAQTLLDAMPCIALLLRSDKVVVGSNKKAADLGIVPGVVCYEAWKAENKPCPWCRSAEMPQINTLQRREIDAGEDCWEIYWVPISQDLFLHYAFDITDRKRSERELKAYARKLEFLNEELQEFAFVASHDLQEPLRKIQTFGHIVATKYEDSLGTEGMDYLMRMTKAANRMSELLRSLLIYSRVVTQPNPFDSTDLAKVVQDAASDMELVIRRANGRLEIGELPVLDADAAQFRQVFQNLIGNSMKYCKESEAPIVKIYATIGEGMCRLFIEDNGIGFDEKYVDRIFRPFQRLHGRSSKYDGTGMGLAICRKIVERHGGNITARSALGSGTTFIVEIPMRKIERKGA
jgi:signal transduction histidine kinase